MKKNDPADFPLINYSGGRELPRWFPLIPVRKPEGNEGQAPGQPANWPSGGRILMESALRRPRFFTPKSFFYAGVQKRSSFVFLSMNPAFASQIMTVPVLNISDLGRTADSGHTVVLPQKVMESAFAAFDPRKNC